MIPAASCSDAPENEGTRLKAEETGWEAEEGRDSDGLFAAEWQAMVDLTAAATLSNHHDEMIRVARKIDRAGPVKQGYVYAYGLAAIRYQLVERFGRMPLRSEIGDVATERNPWWSLRIVGRRDELERILLASAGYNEPPRDRPLSVRLMQTLYAVTALSDGDVVGMSARLRPLIAEYWRQDPWLLDD